MAAKSFPISKESGDTEDITFTHKKQGVEVEPPPGSAFELHIETSETDNTPLVTAITATITCGVEITFDGTTLGGIAVGDYYYRIKRVLNTKTLTYAKGRYSVS